MLTVLAPFLPLLVMAEGLAWQSWAKTQPFLLGFWVFWVFPYVFGF
jgi:hypothetical protein